MGDFHSSVVQVKVCQFLAAHGDQFMVTFQGNMLPASSLQDDGICCRWILRSLGGGYVYICIYIYIYLMNLIPSVCRQPVSVYLLLHIHLGLQDS